MLGTESSPDRDDWHDKNRRQPIPANSATKIGRVDLANSAMEIGEFTSLLDMGRVGDIFADGN